MASSVLHFLELLEQSKLLDGRQLTEARSLADGEALPKTIARKLVHRCYLTRWQARVLVAGKKGSFFFGKYELLEPLGHGAMGSVFKARQRAMTRIVALKIMSARLLKDQRALTRFKREIRAAGALDHPHIIHAFDAGYVKNKYFLVMEYAAGHDLKHWIAAAGKSVKWCCECIRQAALGLQHAHERGIVHRDIKPSNLLLIQKAIDDPPLLKIVDFGFARAALDVAGDPALTRIGQALGTSDYMAPEQAQDATQSDIRADIFSLGCTLFELLSGRVPFRGTSAFERLMARLKQDAPLVSSLRPDICPELDQIVAQMLARDPARRFQTPAEVAEALAPFSWTDQGKLSESESARAGESANSSPGTVGNADPTVQHFLQSLSTDHSIKSLPTASLPGTGQKRRIWLPWVIAAFALLLTMIVSWALG